MSLVGSHGVSLVSRIVISFQAQNPWALNERTVKTRDAGSQAVSVGSCCTSHCPPRFFFRERVIKCVKVMHMELASWHEANGSIALHKECK